jgi:hypothetical protein
MNANDRMGRAEMSVHVLTRFARISAATIAVTLTMACGGSVEGASESPAEPIDDHASGMIFATEQDAFDWVVRRSTELGIDVSTKQDSQGRRVGVAGLSIGAPFEVAAKHAQLLREIGGAEQAVRIAGKAYSVAPQAEPDLASTAQPLCSGELCTSHESFRNNYVFYREIGSRTNVTAGGFEMRRQVIQGQTVVDCFDPPGPIPIICRNLCSFSQDCPAGLTQESFEPYPVCRKTCSGNVRNVTLTLTAQAWEWVGGVLAPSFGNTKTTHDPSLEVRFSEWIIPGTDTAISNAAGLCGTHNTSGPGGASVFGHSHVGSVPSSCL